MTSKKSAPPRFRNHVPYKVWKNKLSVWTLVTAVLKREQAIIVLLESLDGNHKAEKAVADLTAVELNKDDGLKILLEKLDVSFQAYKIDDASLVLKAWENHGKTMEKAWGKFHGFP